MAAGSNLHSCLAIALCGLSYMKYVVALLVRLRFFGFPVVDVDGSLMVRPDVEVAIQQYREKLYQQAGYD